MRRNGKENFNVSLGRPFQRCVCTALTYLNILKKVLFFYSFWLEEIHSVTDAYPGKNEWLLYSTPLSSFLNESCGFTAYSDKKVQKESLRSTENILRQK